MRFHNERYLCLETKDGFQLTFQFLLPPPEQTEKFRKIDTKNPAESIAQVLVYDGGRAAW